jgi:hypothetical protein
VREFVILAAPQIFVILTAAKDPRLPHKCVILGEAKDPRFSDPQPDHPLKLAKLAANQKESLE